MKSFKQILLLSLTLLLISCSSGDSTPIDINAQEEGLVGTWALTGVVQDGKVSTEVEGISVKGDVEYQGTVFTINSTVKMTLVKQ